MKTENRSSLFLFCIFVEHKIDSTNYEIKRFMLFKIKIENTKIGYKM